jgi:PAS domain S-box-containing protein
VQLQRTARFGTVRSPQSTLETMPSSTLARPAEVADRTPWPRAPASWVRPAARAALVALAYYVGARVGFAFQSPSSPQSVLWLPNSILFGALLVLPPSRWPAVLLAAFPAHLIGAWQSGAPTLPLSLLFATNCADAALGAFLVRRLSDGPPWIQGLRNVLVFLACAALAPAVVSFADAGITVWTHWGTNYGEALATRVRANVLTNLIVVPAIVALFGAGAAGLRRLRQRQVLEAALLIGGLLALSIVVFGTETAAQHLPALLLAPLPFLLWAAMRLGSGMTAVALFVVAFASSWNAVRGRGPFAAQSPHDTIVAVQLFLLAISLPLLILAGAVQERERAMAALRGSERGAHRQLVELDAIYRTAPAGLASLDRELRYVSVNEALADLSGLPASAHIGRSIREIVPALADEMESLINASTTREGVVLRRELRGATGSAPGVVRDWLVSCCAVRDGEGTEARINLAVQEITERRRAEEAVRAGEARMVLAGVAANLGFWELDLRTDVIWLSEHSRSILGLPRDMTLTRARVLKALHPDDVAQTNDAFEAAIVGRLQYAGEFRIVRGDGEVRWLSARGQLVDDESGAPTRVAGAMVDITERKSAELEAHEQQRALAHLGRVALVGELSGALAHELRQPLTAILANARAATRLMAAEPPDLEEVRAILTDIAADDARAGEVIHRLRALLKKDDARLETLALDDVARDVLRIAQGDLVSRGVTVVTEFAPGLPSARGDRVQLQQVLLNLVLNACDAMAGKPPGERRLTVRTRVGDAGRVTASVADCGTGIPADGLEQVFHPFVTTKARGLGLGLAICRTIVAAHDGRLWAENNADGGASFFMALPAYAAGARAAQ